MTKEKIFSCRFCVSHPLADIYGCRPLIVGASLNFSEYLDRFLASPLHQHLIFFIRTIIYDVVFLSLRGAG